MQVCSLDSVSTQAYGVPPTCHVFYSESSCYPCLPFFVLEVFGHLSTVMYLAKLNSPSQEVQEARVGGSSLVNRFAERLPS